MWDALGIAAGVFVKGDSALLIGVDLAPQLPLEEPLFLAFLSYLALVVWAGALRLLSRGDARDARCRVTYALLTLPFLLATAVDHRGDRPEAALRATDGGLGASPSWSSPRSPPSSTTS